MQSSLMAHKDLMGHKTLFLGPFLGIFLLWGLGSAVGFAEGILLKALWGTCGCLGG